MKYRILWHRRAKAELATVWLNSTDQNGVTRASHDIEAHLKRHPLLIGTPRTSSVHRVAYDAPIGIEYEVIEDDKKVIVRGVFAHN